MSRVDRWLQRAEELKKETAFGDVNYVKLKEGPNVMRIIPPKEPREDFWLEVEKSFNIGPNSKVVIRPSQFGLPDPVSDEIAKLKAAGDEISMKRADAMKGKKRAMMWVIMRAEEASGYQMFDTNLIVLRDILAIMTDAEYGDITDPEKGVDITINYTPGTKKSFPKWQIVPKRNSSPLGHPEALAEDLFEKHRIGEPSEVDYILACLEGSEEAYIEAKKADRQASSSSGRQEAASPPPPSQAPAGDENAAVQAELDRIRAEKAAAAAPAPPATPPPPAAPGGTDPKLLKSDWWAVIEGNTKQVKGSDIQALVAQGHGNMNIMPYPQGDWTTAEAAGFKAGGAPPPPPSSQVGADLEEALG